MRTKIDTDDRLIRHAMKSSGVRTKRAVVEAGLRLLVQTRAQTNIRQLRGKIRWEGILQKSRRGATSEVGTSGNFTALFNCVNVRKKILVRCQ
jgi:Arc/MetJ family transcription regulator